MGEILLRAENIDKHFGITHALDNVSFTFEKGEIHALIGENGSGKSTLTSCLTGIYQKDSGKFILEGKEITATNQVEANHQGVAIIVQEIGTLSGLTVAENIFLGNEDQFTKHGIKNTAAMNKKAQEYLDSYGFNYIDATKVIDDYNFEDRKLVEIVKSTYFNPKVLVVDETTTALGQKGREELFKVMHKVRDTGNCVIFISHDLEEVIEQSDNISVLRDGVKIGSITKEEATPDRLKALMVGREIGDSYYRTDYGEKVSDEVVLSAKNVTVKGQIENLNLDLHKGEILGIGGLSECGMHEVGKALFGASYFRQGSVTLGDGTPINSIPDAIKHSIAYASKDRDNESLVINDTIGDNICLPSLEDLKTHGFLRAKTMNEFANKFAKQMSTKMTGVDQFVSALSGGNKQKVVLARWVGKDSDLIILDSPTRGIDVKVKADIYAMMDDMRKRGKSIIMISEEIMELLGMADRILIMKDGKINGEFLRSPDLKDTDLIVRTILPIAGFVIICVLFAILTDGRLFQPKNISLLLSQSYMLLISSIGVFMVMTMGGLDFSQGSMLGVASIVVCYLSHYNMVLAALGGVVTGGLIGLINGYFNVKRKITSFIVTICTMYLFRGVCAYATTNSPVYAVSDISKYNTLPFMLTFTVIIFVVAYLVFTYTGLGSRLKAIGAGETAARFAGIRVETTKILVFVAAGCITGLAAFVNAIKVGSVTSTAGNQLETQIMIALVLGGMPVNGGAKVRFYNIILGVMTYKVLSSGLVMLMMPTQLQQLILGIIFLIEVAIFSDRKTGMIVK